MDQLSSFFDELTGSRTGSAAIIIIGIFIVMLAVAVIYFARLLKMFKPVHDQLMPLGGKIAFWGALAYTIFPVDILPDPLMIDDIGVLAFAVAYINHLRNQVDADGGSEPVSTRSAD